MFMVGLFGVILTLEMSSVVWVAAAALLPALALHVRLTRADRWRAQAWPSWPSSVMPPIGSKLNGTLTVLLIGLGVVGVLVSLLVR